MTSSLSFADVWGLDSDSIAFIPRPVAALILCFPITEEVALFLMKYDESSKLQQAGIEKIGSQIPSSLFYMRQTIPNACGTIAVIHALANNTDKLQASGTFKQILQETSNLDPYKRAIYLEKMVELQDIHAASSIEGQSQVFFC